MVFQTPLTRRLVAATAAPLIPLTLTVISLEELLSRLIKIIF
jgi:hypothetical protein